MPQQQSVVVRQLSELHRLFPPSDGLAVNTLQVAPHPGQPHSGEIPSNPDALAKAAVDAANVTSGEPAASTATTGGTESIPAIDVLQQKPPAIIGVNVAPSGGAELAPPAESLRIPDEERAELQQQIDAAATATERLEKKLRVAERKLDKSHQHALQLEATLAAREQKLAELRLHNREQRSRLNHLQAEHDDGSRKIKRLSARVAALEKEHESLSTRASSYREQRNKLRSLLKIDRGLHVQDVHLLRWLLAEGGPASIGLEHGDYLGWTGLGPYEPEVFDDLLTGLGLQQHELPNKSISHVVVGRSEWSRDDLEEQIALRRGSTLRVYSQEMLVAALITGRDPLDADDDLVLTAFKHGHGALEYLAGDALQWPNVWIGPREGPIAPLGDESLGVRESPLHILGYEVGETSSLSTAERRNILRNAFCLTQLPWVESAAYMTKWGGAKSKQRLWRIAMHIAMQLRGPGGKDYRKPLARAHWIEDLGWLKAEIYTRRDFDFAWPDIYVR